MASNQCPCSLWRKRIAQAPCSGVAQLSLVSRRVWVASAAEGVGHVNGLLDSDVCSALWGYMEPSSHREIFQPDNTQVSLGSHHSQRAICQAGNKSTPPVIFDIMLLVILVVLRCYVPSSKARLPLASAGCWKSCSVTAALSLSLPTWLCRDTNLKSMG